MQYVLLIHTDEAEYARRPQEELARSHAEYMQLAQDLQQRGALRAGERLRPVSTATSVRVRDGKTLTTDGPFAETREQLGGFYVVDVPDLDAAVKIAARIPGARSGTIEVRPVWPMAEK